MFKSSDSADVTTPPFWRKPDNTLLLCNTDSGVQVCLKKLYDAIAALAAEANIGEQNFEMWGDPLDSKLEIKFIGPSPAVQALQFDQSLQLGRGRWKEQRVPCGDASPVQFYIQPDKTSTTMKKILAKALKEIVTSHLPADKQVFVHKSTRRSWLIEKCSDQLWWVSSMPAWHGSVPDVSTSSWSRRRSKSRLRWLLGGVRLPNLALPPLCFLSSDPRVLSFDGRGMCATASGEGAVSEIHSGCGCLEACAVLSGSAWDGSENGAHFCWMFAWLGLFCVACIQDDGRPNPAAAGTAICICPQSVHLAESCLVSVVPARRVLLFRTVRGRPLAVAIIHNVAMLAGDV